MRISTSVRHALSICIAAVMLAGCSGGSQLAPSSLMQSSTSTTAQSGRTHALGLITPNGTIGDEIMSGGAGTGCRPDVGEFGASGKVISGPYLGKFSARGSFGPVACNGGSGTVKEFSETFTIHSGSRTVTGSVMLSGTGTVTWSCRSDICSLGPSSAFTYTATLTRDGKVRKSFSGGAGEDGITNHGPFIETLQ